MRNSSLAAAPRPGSSPSPNRPPRHRRVPHRHRHRSNPVAELLPLLVRNSVVLGAIACSVLTMGPKAKALGHPVHGSDSDVHADAIRETSSVVPQHDVVLSEKPSKVGGNDATVSLNPSTDYNSEHTSLVAGGRGRAELDPKFGSRGQVISSARGRVKQSPHELMRKERSDAESGAISSGNDVSSASSRLIRAEKEWPRHANPAQDHHFPRDATEADAGVQDVSSSSQDHVVRTENFAKQ